VDNAQMIAGIKNLDSKAWEKFWLKFYRPMMSVVARRYLRMFRAGNVSDVVNDALLRCVEQIRRGTEVNPDCLSRYVLVVVTRFAAQVNYRHAQLPSTSLWEREDDKATKTIRCPRPTVETELLLEGQSEILRKAMEQLRPSDRDLLIRFYYQGQTLQEVMTAYGITDTQFRLRKTRALIKLYAKVHGMARLTNPGTGTPFTLRALRKLDPCRH
jgi:RNA polymerase sigma factor (sigma-70 family)